MKLKEAFHEKMVEIYHKAADECSYRPTRFLQMVQTEGGLTTAKKLMTGRPSDGLAELFKRGRPDLSVEALVCDHLWTTLFTAEEIATAKRRLGK